MKRFVRYSLVMAVMVVCGVGTARAQTSQTSQTSGTPAPGRGYAELTLAATLGHVSASSIGVEAGYGVTDALQIFFEGGRMGNVATSDIDTRAQKIANAIGATVSTVQKAAYFDAGVKYRLREYGMWRPYALLGLGAASVTTTANFFIGGNDVTSHLDQYGVLLGSDLSGSSTKFLLTIGGGADVKLGKRYLAGLSYRYGHISPKTSEIENDQPINTQRVQVAFGIRF